MSRSRSPNYPSLDLGEAIEVIRKVYAVERRAQFPRTSLAGHMGYTSINGRSLAKIGAIRAYGLIDGREDSLTVSGTAIAILEAPDGSSDKVNAYRAAFLSPSIFARAHEQYGNTPPSPQTFRWWLTQQGYLGEAADKAMQAYLSSLELVNSVVGTSNLAEELEREEQLADHMQEDPRLHAMFYSAAPKPKVEPVRKRPPEDAGLAMGAHERVLQSGLLSRAASYRVIVSGPVGEAELDRLIAKLEMDKAILADPDIDEAPDDEDRDPRA
jgi:hypothetical protein